MTFLTLSSSIFQTPCVGSGHNHQQVGHQWQNQHNFVAQRYFHPQELITPPAPKYLMLFPDHWELEDDFDDAHQ